MLLYWPLAATLSFSLADWSKYDTKYLKFTAVSSDLGHYSIVTTKNSKKNASTNMKLSIYQKADLPFRVELLKSKCSILMFLLALSNSFLGEANTVTVMLWSQIMLALKMRVAHHTVRCLLTRRPEVLFDLVKFTHLSRTRIGSRRSLSSPPPWRASVLYPGALYYT